MKFPSQLHLTPAFSNGAVGGEYHRSGVVTDAAVFVPNPGQVLNSLFHGLGDGGLPEDDRLVLDAAGNLFGTTSNGGTFNLCPAGCGVVFKVEQ